MAHSLCLTPTSNCMDLVPYVAPEKALGLQKLSVPVANYALAFLKPADLPALACTSKANQRLAVSHCFNRMRDSDVLGYEGSNWPNAVSLCRGTRNPFKPQDLLDQIDGAMKTQCVSIAPFLADPTHNARLAAKLPLVEYIHIPGPTPNLSHFATCCSQLTRLHLSQGTLTGEEPINGRFPSLRKLILQDCGQLTDAGLRQLLTHCPQIESCTVMQEAALTPAMQAINLASDNGTLNETIHGKKAAKPEPQVDG